MASPASLPSRATSWARPLQRAEQGRVEAERAVPTGEIAPPRKGLAAAPRRRVARRGMSAREAAKDAFGGAADGDADEIVVVETDERRFQRRRERQVVVGQERRASGRDEVERRRCARRCRGGRRPPPARPPP